MENNKTFTVYKQMAKWQVMATVFVALIAGYFAGLHGALSALAGGGSAIAGGFAASIMARRSEHNKEAGAILIGLLKAEAVKILTIIILLFITFKIYTDHLVPWALILGLAAAAILSGVAVTALDKNAHNEKSET